MKNFSPYTPQNTIPELLILLSTLLISCQSTSPTLTQEAYEQGTISIPAYDYPFDILWKAAMHTVQIFGYTPHIADKTKKYIVTNLKKEEENSIQKSLIASRVYIYITPTSTSPKPIKKNYFSYGKYTIRICIPRFEKIDNQWEYKDSDILAQKALKKKLETTLYQMYLKKE